MIKKGSGFQRKYLRYTIGLLLLALLLSSLGVWFYMRQNMMRIVTDQYAFLNEKTGIALDNLYQESDKVLEECILDDTVQQSLKARPLEEVDKNSLKKYFAYVNLNYVSEYCYVDNKQNLYTRSYSKIPYSSFQESGLLDKLGHSYADTQWFVTEDTLFGTGEKALFIGRKVHSLDYAHRPGYLFLKMGDGFLDSLKEDNDFFNQTVAIGVMDQDGDICASWYPTSFSVGDDTEELLRQYSREEKSGVVVRSEKVPDGMLSLYKQEQTGFCVFTIVPNQVLSRGTGQILYVLLGIYLLVILFAVMLSVYFSNRITKPIKVINQAMTEFDGNDFSNEVHLNTHTELDQIGNAYNKMLSNIKNLLEEIKDQQKELRTSELNMLISQINPHFLYNTLDSIQWMCEQDNSKDAVKMVGALAKLFRISISHGNEFITISDELKHAESYLIIQSYRYKNQFTYSFDIDKSVLGYMCNKITIQPFIENAIYHGLDRMVDEGEIKIIVRRQGKDIVIIVKDNGLGMTQEQCRTILQKDRSDSKGIGVKNVNDRLKIYFGEEYGITIESELDVGTTVTIKIPKIEKGQEHEY